MWELVLKAINVLIALCFIPYLFMVYRRTDRSFYLFWGIGFSLFGFRLVLRILSEFYYFNAFLPFSPLLFIIYMIGLVFIIAGLGKLVSELIPTTIIVSVLPLTVVLVYVFLGAEEVLLMSNIGLYSFICIILPYLNRKYNLSLNYLMMGLATISVANVVDQFQLLNSIFGEGINIAGRVFLFLGILQPKFKFLAYDISGFMSAQEIVKVNSEYESSVLVMLESDPECRRAEITFFTDKLKENISRGIRTILIVLYDLITFDDLAKFGVEKQDLHLVRMLTRYNAVESQSVFQENESVIKDDLEDLDIILSEIIERAGEEGISCEVFLYNLSALINRHGGKRMYSFVTSKIHQLKTKGVSLYAYIHPETHKHKSETAIFKSLADRTQEIF